MMLQCTQGMIKHPNGVWQSSIDRDFCRISVPWHYWLLWKWTCHVRQSRLQRTVRGGLKPTCQPAGYFHRVCCPGNWLRVTLNLHCEASPWQLGVPYLFFRELPTLDMHHQENFPVANINDTTCARSLCFCIPRWKYTDGASILV